MQLEEFQKESCALTDLSVNRHQADDLPQCCGTGCAVCVLDFPESFSSGQPGGSADAETLAMLEAIEQAQLQVDRIFAETNGELQ